jgi:hypothetical protein
LAHRHPLFWFLVDDDDESGSDNCRMMSIPATFPDGRDIVGVQPGHIVPRSLAEVLRECDVTLEEAVTILRDKM